MTPGIFSPVSGCIRSEVWPHELLVLQHVADVMFGLAYTAIPASLLYLRHKRKDIPVDWIAVCFAAFILLCGLRHVFGIITAWWPIYWIEGLVMIVGGIVSMTTAYLLQFPVMKKLLAIPSKEERDKILAEKTQAVADAQKAKGELERVLTSEQVARKEAEEAAAKAAHALAGEQAALAGEKAARKEAEDAATKAAQALAQLGQRDAAIRALSIPVLVLQPGIVGIPIIGTLDSARAAQLATAAVGAIDTHAARHVILDLSGVDVVDSEVAAVIGECAEAVRLRGASTIITGMRGPVAQTCARSAIRFDGMSIGKSLYDGIGLATKGATNAK